jgi:hypothetical protein
MERAFELNVLESSKQEEEEDVEMSRTMDDDKTRWGGPNFTSAASPQQPKNIPLYRNMLIDHCSLVLSSCPQQVVLNINLAMKRIKDGRVQSERLAQAPANSAS